MNFHNGCYASYTSSVAIRRQLPLKGKPINEAKLIKRLPLEGKLSSGRGTDEVASDKCKLLDETRRYEV